MDGLTITESRIQETEKKEACLGLFVCALLILGFARVLLSGFSEVSLWWVTGIGCIAVSLVLWGLDRWIGRGWVWLGGFGAVVLVFLVTMGRCRNGICVLANEWLDYLTGKYGRVYLDFPTEGEGGVYLAAFLALALITLLLVWSVRRRHFAAIGVLFALALAGCVFGFMKADYGLALVVIGIACFLLYGRLSLASIKGLAGVGLGLAAAVLLCAAGAVFAGSRLGFSVSGAHGRLQLKSAVHRLRYDSGTNAMPEGNLVNPGSFVKSEETSLVLTMETPQKLYLRGLTGEVYTGSSWEALGEEERQEGEALFYWLHQSGFYGQTTLAQATALEGSAETSVMQIQNVSACSKYQYLPYALEGGYALNSSSVGDDENLAEGDTAQLTYYPGSLPQWYEAASWLSTHQSEEEVAAYLAQEQSYREYVYDKDLQLTNTVIGVFDTIFEEQDQEGKSLSEILELVRTTLDDTLEYDESTVTYNGKNDFVKYTLEQSKSGYSIHYATAAVLMLRYFGVPARYVEGYYLSADDAANYEADEAIALTEANAHAWAEYYMDGVGWIPFEVTPGYIDEEETQTASQVMADGLGDGSGKSFYQTPLTYTPPKQPEDNQNIPDYRETFRFRTEYVMWVLIALLILLILLALIWILRRRRRLLLFYKEMEQADNREAITGFYGYGLLLQKKCRPKKEPEQNEAEQVKAREEQETIRTINQEARFSSHEMADDQRQQVKQFTDRVIAGCKSRCSLWQRFRYHYIFWLYR